MELILCEEKDYPQVMGLYRRSVARLQATVNYPRWSAEHPSDAGVAEAIRKRELYLCLHRGEPAGALVMNEDPEGRYEDGHWSVPLDRGAFAVIHMLAVDPARERQGVGDFMVASCIALARRKGWRAIRLDVVPGNIPAERLYKKHGFTYAGTSELGRGIDGIPAFDLYELNF